MLPMPINRSSWSGRSESTWKFSIFNLKIETGYNCHCKREFQMDLAKTNFPVSPYQLEMRMNGKSGNKFNKKPTARFARSAMHLLMDG